MSVEERNKAVVRRYVEAFNRGDLDALKSLLADHAEIQGVPAEGDLVAARYTETGTFKAAAFGRAPTGKSYSLVAMEMVVVRDGRITRRRGARDAASQARQLGIDGP